MQLNGLGQPASKRICLGLSDEVISFLTEGFLSHTLDVDRVRGRRPGWPLARKEVSI